MMARKEKDANKSIVRILRNKMLEWLREDVKVSHFITHFIRTLHVYVAIK